jgi:hypothetical protein
MSPDFHDAYMRQFPKRAAEACSELGYAEKAPRHPVWIARWLDITRRWFAEARRSR